MREQVIDDGDEEGAAEGEPGMWCVRPPLCWVGCARGEIATRRLITADPVNANCPNKGQTGGFNGGMWPLAGVWWGKCLAPGPRHVHVPTLDRTDRPAHVWATLRNRHAYRGRLWESNMWYHGPGPVFDSASASEICTHSYDALILHMKSN